MKRKSSVTIATAPSPEVLLAKAYDNLVDSRDSVLSFAQEAAMVAEFTRLYIQNLFHLSETRFKSIMRKNSDLHAKATLNERRGRNPFEVLRQQILRRDDFGRILKRYSKHLGALDCILDVRATAALVHHMVRLKPSGDLPAGVVGCEFGSGLGILSVAGSIPFVHKGKSLTVHAFEQSQESREDSRKITAILQRESRYKDRVQFNFHSGDVTTEEPYQAVKKAAEQSGPVALWISETFGYRSKRPMVSEGAATCTFWEPAGVVPYPPDLEKKYDPLPQVLEQSCRYFESFLQKIRAGDIVAFPDIVTPRVIIDGEMSRILSPDGTWRKLYEIGRPYDMMPPCVPTRWYFEKNV
jgi:hypothetical protein